MPITVSGFSARRYQDIVSGINQELVTRLSQDLKTTPDTVIGVITAIFATAVTEQEELAQAVADNFNIDKAEGKYLDDLVALIGLSRLTAAPTSGFVDVVALEGTLILSGTEFRDVSNNKLLTTQNSLLSQNSCRLLECTPLDVETSPVGTEYTIFVDGREVSYQKQTAETTDDVIAGLISQSMSLGLDSSFYQLDLGGNLFISPRDSNSKISVTLSPLFSVAGVTDRVKLENSVDGPVEILAGDIQKLPAGVSGVISVNNPSALSFGRLGESDEQLRQRQELSFSLSGNTTLNAIVAKLRQLDGVTSARVLENPTTVPDPVTGLPPNSYECIIVGGDDEVVANSIFDSKPAGIQTYGSRSAVVRYDDADYLVRFSRPERVFLFIEIDYQIYDEEQFPANGVDLIKNVVVSSVDSLDSGVDFIPQRLMGPIYNSVPGIRFLEIRAAKSEDPTQDPAGLTFLPSSIPLNQKEVGDVAKERIYISDIT